MNQFLKTSVFLMSSALLLGSCSDENTPNEEEKKEPIESDAKYVGQEVGNFKAEEWLPGGELGTTENVSSNCYEDETPAVTNQGFTARFNQGDLMASTPYTLSNEPYKDGDLVPHAVLVNTATQAVMPMVIAAATSSL